MFSFIPSHFANSSLAGGSSKIMTCHWLYLCLFLSTYSKASFCHKVKQKQGLSMLDAQQKKKCIRYIMCKAGHIWRIKNSGIFLSKWLFWMLACFFKTGVVYILSLPQWPRKYQANKRKCTERHKQLYSLIFHYLTVSHSITPTWYPWTRQYCKVYPSTDGCHDHNSIRREN